MKKFFSKLSATALTLLATTAVAGAGVATAADQAPEPAPAQQAALDLAPNLQVSSAKAPGYAGLVAVHVKNVGTDRYYGEFPIVSFRIDVKTASGPKGVDRLITPGWFNGAYTRDLGFNEKTSTRSFLVTLSNPIKKGEDQLIANLDFGDGLTKEGRIVNYITVTQEGRLEGDTSTSNDQNVDSRTATVSDSGKKLPGLF